jgi:hypothetical protein
MGGKSRNRDDSVFEMLESERARCEAVLERIDRELATLPKGTLCKRRVVSNGKVYLYPCLKYRDASGVKIVHIAQEKAEAVEEQMDRKKRLKAVVKETKVRLATLRALIARGAHAGKEGR